MGKARIETVTVEVWKNHYSRPYGDPNKFTVIRTYQVQVKVTPKRFYELRKDGTREPYDNAYDERGNQWPFPYMAQYRKNIVAEDVARIRGVL